MLLDDVIDDLFGSSVVPNDGVMQRLSIDLVPCHGCLPLIGDADSFDIFQRKSPIKEIFADIQNTLESTFFIMKKLIMKSIYVFDSL